MSDRDLLLDAADILQECGAPVVCVGDQTYCAECGELELDGKIEHVDGCGSVRVMQLVNGLRGLASRTRGHGRVR